MRLICTILGPSEPCRKGGGGGGLSGGSCWPGQKGGASLQKKAT